jgi:hypothetical protein
MASQGTEPFYGIERTDDEGTAILLRDRSHSKPEAETETKALRRNLLEAEKS